LDGLVFVDGIDTDGHGRNTIPRRPVRTAAVRKAMRACGLFR
jgi:hypothetical protein